ncbi:hypothetical protein HCG51_08615 [Tolypothrix sp. PCC 7910]|uniref:hypothetical protein n=1 Tax=Tolypothrix sp. PCC 7910 TaxID=2099387 RepID=UPI0014279D09|nr:hypothetical protein [Tolypothrix sp. PCC 7910]QIR36798.1 hypothetical protein HCG51_08615 [Tolypothrix sp. PCC 7910]
MSLRTYIEHASDKKNFTRLSDYIDFTTSYLEEVSRSLQAVIVCQNEPKYQFWQYKEDGYFNVTRPINGDIMYSVAESTFIKNEFPRILNNIRNVSNAQRQIVCRSIYTMQQCIGAALDGLPVGRANNARKLNGDLFERLMRLIIIDIGIDCESGIVKVPIVVDGVEQCKMSYQHDLIIKFGEQVKGIGSVKTSSKDRIDKIFIDKFLFTRLTDVEIPHIAVFLNDVQRGKKTERAYKVAATFLPGHFKGYTIKLNPLDGVYYCDIRQNMVSDPFLKKHIKTIDHLLCTDIWNLLGVSQGINAEVEVEEDA